MTALFGFIRQERFLYFFAATASLLLSVWLNYRDTVVNPDAICYLLSAESIATSGIRGAMQLCGQAQWPFYSALIYGMAKISHLSYLTSAYVINGFFSLLSVIVFILIVKELGGCKRTLWFAAGVILLAHQFNAVRDSIIRDHGFWAFYLASFFFLLRYFHSPRYLTALAFNSSLFIAALFRIEGFIFLVMLPFLAWLQSPYPLRQRLQHFLALASFPLLISMMMGMYLIVHPHAMAKLGRIADLTYQWQHGVTTILTRFSAMKAALGQYVLTIDSVNDAGWVLMIVFLVWYFFSIIANVSWINALLVGYAWRNNLPSLTRPAFLVLSGYIAINLFITFLFLIERVFLSNRYLLALSLILMLWVPFVLNDLLRQWQLRQQRILFILAAIFIGVSSLGGIFNFGYSKAYIHQAGDWLATHVPASANMYVNDYQVMYYSQHFGKRIFEQYPPLTTMTDSKWKQYDYLALRLSGKENQQAIPLLKEMQLTPIQVFRNKRNDRVEIYSISR